MTAAVAAVFTAAAVPWSLRSRRSALAGGAQAPSPPPAVEPDVAATDPAVANPQQSASTTVDLAVAGEPGEQIDVQVREPLRRVSEMAGAQGAGSLGRSQFRLAEMHRLRGCHADALQAMIDAESHALRSGAPGAFAAFARVNAVDDLLRLGRWDEAERQLAECAQLDLGSTGGVLCAALSGRLHVLRGDLAEARRSLERAAAMLPRDGSFADFRPDVDVGWVMLELAEGHPSDALDRVAAALVAIRDADAEEAFYTPSLHVLGMQALAALAENAHVRGAGDELPVLRRRAEALLQALDDLLLRGVGRNPPEARANRTLAEAEFLRCVGEPHPAGWTATTRRWEDLAEPYPAAYARLRESEARWLSGAPRARIESLLREAHATAKALRAAPLAADIEELARQARVDLDVALAEASSAPAISADLVPDVHDFGLTAREVDVLALLAEGLTNREIGERLFISTKTAAVHLSHIFEKLGVSDRVQAASVAHRSGVIDSKREAR